jgi:hypothetical protein
MAHQRLNVAGIVSPVAASFRLEVAQGLTKSPKIGTGRPLRSPPSEWRVKEKSCPFKNTEKLFPSGGEVKGNLGPERKNVPANRLFWV